MNKRECKGYYDYDVEVEEILIENGMIDDLFYLKDLQQRKLFIKSEIDQSSTQDIIRHILQYNREDAGLENEFRKPILLYITSPGGSLYDGFELIDTIINSDTPVYTVNLGYQYSMAFLIGLAGHKRFASKHSTFLLHDGNGAHWGTTAKVRDEMEFQTKYEEQIKNYVVAHSSITPDEYDKKYRVEWYMFADEAKDKGFVDYILGEDCGIGEIC